MSKILILTDLHITDQDDKIVGLDPFARAQQVLAQAARDHSDIDHLVLTGDLTHHGRSSQYARLRDLLCDVPWPVTFMLGNHDNRDAFKGAFPEAQIDDDGFVQSAVIFPDVRIICLDTLEPDATPKHSGALCDKRLEWLSQELAKPISVPTIVCLHHPPFLTGFTGMDRIGLTNREHVADLLSKGNVDMIVAGHIHRTIFASVFGVPTVTFKSTCHQMPMLLGQVGSSHSINEPGAYGLLTVTENAGIVAHTADVFETKAAIESDISSQ